MLQKKYRTIDEYKNAGAEMRIFNEISAKLVMDMSRVLSASDSDILLRALRRIDRVRSRAEDNMFRDYPELSNEYLSIFYGSLGGEPQNAIDEEVNDIARRIAGGLIEGKND